ncbi:hypothetical protein AFV9_gp48 [Betalipothrixvirus uzonense]|uniref:Uncharacterized protein n=1 Tax=Betalipothrixvirus uzonense TaxID=512792 RepID=B2CRM5_9VIRU|nr:hypothetical protein AFV9_gp48 [Acidianus filamentous virus 9]ACB37282.1 hypothetical protein [Acidianus filamentous virus 9]
MSYYYEEETVDVLDIFKLLNTIQYKNPAQFRQLYINTVYQFLYDVSLYLPYFPPGNYTLFETDNFSLYISNNTIKATYNGFQLIGLLNIAQTIAQILNFDFALLNSFLSAVYYNLTQIAKQIIPPDNVKKFLQDLYNLLVSKA